MEVSWQTRFKKDKEKIIIFLFSRINQYLNERKSSRLLTFISLKFLLVSVLFIASVFVFALIANEAVLENEKVFDDKVLAFFSSISTPQFIRVMEVFTFFGSVYFMLPAYLILIGYFFFKKIYRFGVDIAVVCISSTLLMQVLKFIFHRKRPNLPVIKGITSYSFPSGHALSAFIFCSILVFVIINGIWKKVYKWTGSVLLMLFALCIGISRIVLKVHYPTDVIGSYCLGIVWVVISLYFLKKMNRKYPGISEPGFT